MSSLLTTPYGGWVLKRCSRCGITKDVGGFTSNRATPDGKSRYCRECLAEYRTTRADKAREATYRWREANRERHRGVARNYQTRNRERINAQSRESKRLCSARRRAQVAKTALVTFTADQLANRWAYYGGKCWLCGAEASASDHVKPLAKGGAHMLCNLRPICKPCNSRKRDRWPLGGCPIKQLEAV